MTTWQDFPMELRPESSRSPQAGAGEMGGHATAKGDGLPLKDPSASTGVGAGNGQPAPALSLIAKLAQACDAVEGVVQTEKNETQNYNYARAADIMKAIRHELFSREVIILQNDACITHQNIEYKNARGETKHANEARVQIEFLITDGKEEIRKFGWGIAWDHGDKAIWKAKTGALKYFIRGLGLIPDEKADPEADESIDRAAKGKETDEEFDRRTEAQQRIAIHQIQGIDEAIKRTGKTPEEVLTALGFLGINRIEHIKRGEFQEFLKWANFTPEKKEKILEAVQGKPRPVEPSVQAKPQLPAMKRVWALAGKYKIPEEQVKKAAYEKFSIPGKPVKSMTELSELQLVELGDWIDEVGQTVS